MAITRQKKAEILNWLKEMLERAVSVVFVNFRGLTVAQLTGLRRQLKEQSASFTMVKKTLLRLALSSKKIGGESPPLVGEVALAYLETADADALAAARGLREFEKKHKGGLKFLGGIFSGQFIDAGKMAEFAAIPVRPVLYGQLVGLLSSPLRRLTVVLDQISKKIN